MEKFFEIFILLNVFFLKTFVLNNECDRDTPILTENGCELKYCSNEKFTSLECSVNNTIIKTQWLNNIILFDFDKLRYGSFTINSKGDMIFECSTNGNIRVIYWLNKDGSFYFENENGEKIPTKIIIVNNGDENPTRYESSIMLVSINNDKEYLLSIPIYKCSVELYDLENNEVSFVPTLDFTNYLIFTFKNVLMENKIDNSKEYFYIFVGQMKEDQTYSKFYLILQKYSFS